jgi:hypothetical protein
LPLRRAQTYDLRRRIRRRFQYGIVERRWKIDPGQIDRRRRQRIDGPGGRRFSLAFARGG